MPRLYGYALQGTRCGDTQDWQARGRLNVIGALCAGVLLTVAYFTGSINGDVFHAWVTQGLLPRLPPQSVVILDNASFHKRPATRQQVEDAGHTLLFLPPYSPDLNPIEHKWAEAKRCRRKYRCSVDEVFTRYL